MNNFIEFLSNNGLISALLAAAILGFVGWLWKKICDSKDSESIYQFLVRSKSETEFNFRSTHAIASHTKLTEERVAILCARHEKIRRNQNEHQSWTLTE